MQFQHDEYLMQIDNQRGNCRIINDINLEPELPFEIIYSNSLVLHLNNEKHRAMNPLVPGPGALSQQSQDSWNLGAIPFFPYFQRNLFLLTFPSMKP